MVGFVRKDLILKIFAFGNVGSRRDGFVTRGKENGRKRTPDCCYCFEALHLFYSRFDPLSLSRSSNVKSPPLSFLTYRAFSLQHSGKNKKGFAVYYV